MAVSRLPVISSKRTFHYLWICSVMTCFALIHQVLADDVITASPIFLNTNDDSSSDKGVLIIENDQSRLDLLEKQLGDWKLSLMGKSGRQADDQVSAAFQRFFHSCSLKHGPGKVDAIKISLVQAQTCLEPIFSSNQRRLRFFNNREERILTSNSMYEFLLEENQLEENEDANSFNDVISLFCKRDISKIETCMRESLTTFKGCTDGAGDQDLDVIYSAGRAALEYICHNNGEQIIEFIKKDGSKCLSQTLWTDCIFQKRVVPVLEQWELNHSIFSPNNCRTIHSQSDDCIAQNFEDCVGNDINGLIRGFTETAMNKTNCQESPLFSNNSGNPSGGFLPAMILSFIFGRLLL